MAHLLGSKACIDSLHADIEDLQEVLHQILNQTGSLKCHSWKYPDRLATDLEIGELLQRYQYGKHQVDNQVSHIVLFELIIDRLLLIIHGSWRYFHTIQSQILPDVADATASTVQHPTSLSVGLVVKKYWTKLSHLHSLLQQHSSSSRLTTAISVRSNETLSQSSQTVETSFAPCSSCRRLQDCLEQQGRSIIDLCHQYSLPSVLVHHRCLTSAPPISMTVDDLHQWSDDQSKDLQTLTKHLGSIQNHLTKKREELKSNEVQRKKHEETIRQLQQTMNEDKQTKKVLQELHESKLNEMKKDLEQKISQLNEQVQSLTRQKNSLKDQVKTLEETCRSQSEQLIEFDSSKVQLKRLNEERGETMQRLKQYEQDHIRLETELEVIKRDLDERQRDLQKERLRIEHLIRQEQNSQALIAAHQTLIEEHQLLKQKFIVVEAERDQLLKVPKHLSDHDQSSQTGPPLPAELLQLISSYNEMPGQLDTLASHPHLLRMDLQKQIQTNELHIELLKKQNETFRSSMEKLAWIDRPSTSTVVETKKTVTPVRTTPLFLLNNEIVEQESSRNTPSPDVVPLASAGQKPTATSHVSAKRSARSTSGATFRCVLCQKTFSDKRNFDIHRLYCRT